MSKQRVYLIVLDSFGIGHAPDAADFGDEGANTLYTITHSKEYDTPNMRKLGLSCIDGVDYLEKSDNIVGSYGRMQEASKGKDTTIGHWEIAGIVSENALPTYPNGFPKEVLDEFSKRTGREVLCNKPYSGTDVIRDYGEEHVRTGKLIVYTSADSVFQIAAHEDIVPVEELYKYCEIAREILVGEHGVGRVIARPFVGEAPNFQRTTNRHDFHFYRQGTLCWMFCKKKDTILMVWARFMIFLQGRVLLILSVFREMWMEWKKPYSFKIKILMAYAL